MFFILAYRFYSSEQYGHEFFFKNRDYPRCYLDADGNPNPGRLVYVLENKRIPEIVLKRADQ